MNIDMYKESFEKFRLTAKGQTRHYETLKEYQAKLSQLCSDAAEFYRANSQPGEPDYTAKMEIFLEFDKYLKQLKKEFMHTHHVEAQSTPFFKGKQADEENESLLDKSNNRKSTLFKKSS